MSNRKSTALTVEFQTELTSQSDKIELDHHSGFTGLKRGIPFRYYGRSGVKLACSYGTISQIPELRVSDEKEVVSFSGDRTASLKRPIAVSVSCSLVAGLAFDVRGNSVHPVITWNSGKQQLESDIVFYGAADVVYQAPYELYFYEFFTAPITGGGVTLYGNDTIHAFRGKAHATLDMKMDFDIKSTWMPCFEVITKIVLDAQGTWEYPINWRGVDQENKGKNLDDASRKARPMGTFPNYTAYEIDPDNSFTDRRIHLIGTYDILGRVRTERFHEMMIPQAPYRYNSNRSFYDLAQGGLIFFSLEWAKKPDWKPGMTFDERSWAQAYLSIDKVEILNDLTRQFPGLTSEQSS